MRLLGHEILGPVSFSDRKAGYAGSCWRKWIEARAVIDHVAEVQVVAGGQVVVDPESTLIRVVLFGFCRYEGVESTVWFWEKA